jgi:acetyl esterase/lipase
VFEEASAQVVKSFLDAITQAVARGDALGVAEATPALERAVVGVAIALAEAGVAVKLQRYPGQFHGFITMGKIMPKANEALQDIGGWLKGL